MKRNSSTVQIKQIAELVGMSPSTVSIVLNGRGNEMRIAKETQQRIQEAAKTLHYQPASSGGAKGALNRRTNQIIAVFWNDTFMESSMGKFFKGMSLAEEKNGYRAEYVVRLFQSGRLSEYREIMNLQRYDGIIIAGPADEDVRFINKEQFDVPLVLSGRFGERSSSVYTDGYMIGEECARMFYKKGIRKAGFIGSCQETRNSGLREFGFLSTCEKLGIMVLPKWINKDETRDMEGGYLSARRLMDLENRPQAVFVTHDTMMLGILFAFMEAGVHIPDEMSIVAYGFNKMLQRTSPSITMIGNPMEVVGESSMELLMTIIDHHITMPVNRMIPPLYISGDSFPLEEGDKK